MEIKLTESNSDVCVQCKERIHENFINKYGICKSCELLADVCPTCGEKATFINKDSIMCYSCGDVFNYEQYYEKLFLTHFENFQMGNNVKFFDNYILFEKNIFVSYKEILKVYEYHKEIIVKTPKFEIKWSLQASIFKIEI